MYFKISYVIKISDKFGRNLVMKIDNKNNNSSVIQINKQKI